MATVMIKTAGDMKRRNQAVDYIKSATAHINDFTHEAGTGGISHDQAEFIAKVAVGICYGNEDYKRQLARLRKMYPLTGKTDVEYTGNNGREG